MTVSRFHPPQHKAYVQENHWCFIGVCCFGTRKKLFLPFNNLLALLMSSSTPLCPDQALIIVFVTMVPTTMSQKDTISLPVSIEPHPLGTLKSGQTNVQLQQQASSESSRKLLHSELLKYQSIMVKSPLTASERKPTSQAYL